MHVFMLCKTISTTMIIILDSNINVFELSTQHTHDKTISKMSTFLYKNLLKLYDLQLKQNAL